MGAEQSTPISPPQLHTLSLTRSRSPLPYPPQPYNYPSSRRYPSPKPGHPSRKRRSASPLPIPPEMLAVPKEAQKARSGSNSRLAKTGLGGGSRRRRMSMFSLASTTSKSPSVSPSLSGRGLDVGGDRSRGGDGRNEAVGMSPPIRVGFPYYEEVLVSAEREGRKSCEGKRRKFRRSLGVR